MNIAPPPLTFVDRFRHLPTPIEGRNRAKMLGELVTGGELFFRRRQRRDRADLLRARCGGGRRDANRRVASRVDAAQFARCLPNRLIARQFSLRVGLRTPRAAAAAKLHTKGGGRRAGASCGSFRRRRRLRRPRLCRAHRSAGSSPSQRAKPPLVAR